MDNNQQNTYGYDVNQYQQNAYGYDVNQYQQNGYGYDVNGYQQNAYGYDVNGYQQYVNDYNVSQDQRVEEVPVKRRIVGVGMIMGLLSSLLMLIGLLMPIIDFSYFHSEIDIQYNLIKVCKNIRLVSPIWTALPIGIIIGIVLMAILSFVRIPQFRLVPFIIVLAMFIVMLADVNNLIAWANEFLNSDIVQSVVMQEFVIDKAGVMNSIMPGAYVLAAGLVTGFISSFIKPSDK